MHMFVYNLRENQSNYEYSNEKLDQLLTLNKIYELDEILLEDKTQEVVLENIDSNEWVKLNPNMSSFFIVNYPNEMFEQFVPSIVDQSMSTIDRLSLQNDLFYLVQSGKVSSDRLLKFMENFSNEESNAVWESIITCLDKFNTILAYTDFQEVFHLYVSKLLAKIYVKLGSKPIPGEDHQKMLLRNHVFSMLVSCKDPQVLQEAKAQFESHVSNLVHIHPDLRGTVYRAVASDCDDKTYELFFKIYHENDLDEEKERLGRALGTTTDVIRLQRFIDFVMNEVRKQDASLLLGCAATANKVALEFVWNYFKENHNVFKERYESGSLIARLVKELTSNFATEEKIQEISTFFGNNPIPSTERTVQQSLELIKSNVDLLSRDALAIKNYLNNLI